MKAPDFTIDTAILALVIGAADPVFPLREKPKPLTAANLSGLHDFDVRSGGGGAALAAVRAPYLLEPDAGHGPHE